ncbi:MAG: hypothetical protein LBP59_02710 [Planctomycetaceae bacterium]|nr:hypothetical protein [Planctomycetaceae bacterium]
MQHATYNIETAFNLRFDYVLYLKFIDVCSSYLNFSDLKASKPAVR